MKNSEGEVIYKIRAPNNTSEEHLAALKEYVEGGEFILSEE